MFLGCFRMITSDFKVFFFFLIWLKVHYPTCPTWSFKGDCTSRAQSWCISVQDLCVRTVFWVKTQAWTASLEHCNRWSMIFFIWILLMGARAWLWSKFSFLILEMHVATHLKSSLNLTSLSLGSGWIWCQNVTWASHLKCSRSQHLLALLSVSFLPLMFQV